MHVVKIAIGYIINTKKNNLRNVGKKGENFTEYIIGFWRYVATETATANQDLISEQTKNWSINRSVDLATLTMLISQ